VALSGAISFPVGCPLAIAAGSCRCPPDPQGTNPKPKTKKEGLGCARALPTVQAALHRHDFAVAAANFPEIPLATPAPATTSLLPPPYLPSFEYPNGVFLPSIGSFGSSGEAEALNAPVGPDAL